MSELSLPSIGLGTGGEAFLDGAENVEVISTAIDLGYRHIDTAEMYGNHESVGDGIRASNVPRDEIIVATKILPDHLASDDATEALERSRNELGLDRIDLAYVHFPSPSYDPAGTLSAFQEMAANGVIDHIGVSNFSVEEAATALDFLGDSLVAIQVELHPFCQQPELIEFAQNNDCTLVGYAPLARGSVFPDETIQEIAEKYDTHPATVVLSWVTGYDNVGVVVKSTNTDHLAANLEAPALSLDAEDVRRIESIDREERLIDPRRYLPN